MDQNGPHTSCQYKTDNNLMIGQNYYLKLILPDHVFRSLKVPRARHLTFHEIFTKFDVFFLSKLQAEILPILAQVLTSTYVNMTQMT